jgi:nifR3 family TIM-barrel protein
MNNFKWSKIKKPVFILAPMAEITTLPFHSICKEMGADIVFTPMLASNAIVYNPGETLKIAEFLSEEQPVIVQLFGYDGDLIARAANIVQERINPAGIDINMGCPAPKITGNECGSGLLRDYDKALEIMKHVRANYTGQLSVKVRLGWRDKDVKQFVKQLEEIGIDAISIHGRTTKEGYRGLADWDTIYDIADSVDIPVIGNGDITTAEEAWSRLENGKLAGVMIGRGALGNPWIFQGIKRHTPLSSLVASPGISDGLSEGDSCLPPRLGEAGRRNDKSELARVILDQTNRTIMYLGDEGRAIREMRKHYGWYLKGFPGAQGLRKRAMLAETLTDVKEILSDLK